MATIAEQSSELRLATFRLSRRLRAEKTDEALSDGQVAVLGVLFRHGRADPHPARRARAGLGAVDEPHGQLPRGDRATSCAPPTTSTDARRTSRLTDAGRELVKATTSKRDAWLTMRLRELSKEDRAVLARAAELMGGLATQ